MKHVQFGCEFVLPASHRNSWRDLFAGVAADQEVCDVPVGAAPVGFVPCGLILRQEGSEAFVYSSWCEDRQQYVLTILSRPNSEDVSLALRAEEVGVGYGWRHVRFP